MPDVACSALQGRSKFCCWFPSAFAKCLCFVVRQYILDNLAPGKTSKYNLFL